ncbi:glycosyltransferase [Salibacterium sp. K-3]
MPGSPDTLTILYLTPYYHSKRGNATTAKRMKTYLEKAGHEVVVYPFEEEEGRLEEQLDQTDIVHALHVRRTAEFLESNNLSIHQPLVLTSGGTDINIDLQDTVKKSYMEQFLERAGALAVFTGDAKEKVLWDFPWLRDRVTVIPQGAAIPETPAEVDPQLPPGSPKILLPAGMRPVKDVLYVCSALEENRALFPELRFLLVGEVLDENVNSQVKNAEAAYSWFSSHRPVENENMAAFYQWADIVVNTSISEGQPMSLLEGMFYGVPALARKNPGNESVIEPGKNGFLFSSPDEFVQQLRAVTEDVRRYRQMAEEAAEYVQKRHHPEEEATRYIALYRTLLNG